MKRALTGKPGGGTGYSGGIELPEAGVKRLAQGPRHRALTGAGGPGQVDDRPALARSVITVGVDGPRRHHLGVPE